MDRDTLVAIIAIVTTVIWALTALGVLFLGADVTTLSVTTPVTLAVVTGLLVLKRNGHDE